MRITILALIGLVPMMLLMNGPVTVQNQGDTSGPAVGGNITPSTAVQKNRSTVRDAEQNMGAPSAGGAPGVEGPAGSKSGPTQGNPNKGKKSPY